MRAHCHQGEFGSFSSEMREIWADCTRFWAILIYHSTTDFHRRKYAHILSPYRYSSYNVHRYIDIHNWKVWRRTPAPPYFPVINIYIPIDVVWWISIRRKYVYILSPMEICSTMVYLKLLKILYNRPRFPSFHWKLTKFPLMTVGTHLVHLK